MNEKFSPSNSISMSEDIRDITAAKIAARKNFKATGLDSLNPHFKAKYAKLQQIYEAVEVALGDQNIDIVHCRQWFEGRLFIMTRLIHAPTGQWIQDISPIQSEKPGNQGEGSALTFMKRYAVLNLCAIPQGEGDDDGEEERNYIESRDNESHVTSKQQEELENLIKSHPDSRELWKSVSSFNKIQSLAELKAANYNRVKYFIENYKKSVQKT